MEKIYTVEELKQMVKLSNGILKNEFLKIPRSFIANSNLTIQEKMMYIYLWGFVDDKSYGYPSQTRMCEELGASKTTIIKILKSLEEKGGIYILNRRFKNSKEKTTNLYYLAEIDNNTGCFIENYFDIVKQLYPNKTILC